MARSTMKSSSNSHLAAALPAVAIPLILLVMTTLSCAFAEEVLAPEATFMPPPTIAIDQTPAPTVAVETTPSGPTPTLATAPTVTTAATAADLGPPPDDLEGLANWLGQAQTAGIQASEICNILRENQWQQATDGCPTADLDGDGEDEWLLTLDTTLLQPESPSTPADGHPGDLWIVSEGAVVYQVHDTEEPDFFATAPTLVEQTDMTGDDRPEAITVFSTCGAHTCYNYYQVISAHDGQIRNVVAPAGEEEVAAGAGDELPVAISLSYVDEESVEDATGDDLPDLVISGGIVGSAGAGIQRSRTEVWAWDGSAVSLYERLWEDTGYRFHRLYNANYAFEQESHGVAAELYESVITDPTLEDVEYTGTVEETRAHVQQFAGFRLAMLPLFRGDITEATRWRNWLQESYPEAPITRAATLLISEWEANGNDLPAACRVVTDFLDQRENPTGPLTDMGYNNPSLEADDVCPLPRSDE